MVESISLSARTEGLCKPVSCVFMQARSDLLCITEKKVHKAVRFLTLFVGQSSFLHRGNVEGNAFMIAGQAIAGL
jgi:hypothetical protein